MWIFYSHFYWFYLLVYESKYYLQVYLDNCAYRTVDMQMIDYLGDNPIETDEDCVLQMLCYDRTDLSERIDVANSNSRRVA